MHRLTKPKAMLPVLLALALVSAIVIWQLADSDDDTAGQARDGRSQAASARQASRSATPDDPTQTPVVSEADRSLTAAFAVFRTPPEGLPPKTEEGLGAPILGVNKKLAQKLSVKAKAGFWVAPGRDHVCLIEHNPRLWARQNCTRTRDAVKDGAWADFVNVPGRPHWGTPRTHLIVGIAPDGVKAVRARIGTFVTSAPVTDNVFVIYGGGSASDNPELTLR